MAASGRSTPACIRHESFNPRGSNLYTIPLGEGAPRMLRTSARGDSIAVRLVSLDAGRFAQSFAPFADEAAPWRMSFHERGRAELAVDGGVFALPPGRCVLV